MSTNLLATSQSSGKFNLNEYCFSTQMSSLESSLMLPITAYINNTTAKLCNKGLKIKEQ